MGEQNSSISGNLSSNSQGSGLYWLPLRLLSPLILHLLPRVFYLKTPPATIHIKIILREPPPTQTLADLVFKYHLTEPFCIPYIAGYFLLWKHNFLFAFMLLSLSDSPWTSLIIPSLFLLLSPKTLLLPYCSTHSAPSPLVLLLALLV